MPAFAPMILPFTGLLLLHERAAPEIPAKARPYCKNALRFMIAIQDNDSTPLQSIEPKPGY